MSEKTKRSDELLAIRANASIFLKNISHLKTEDDVNTPEARDFLTKSFRNFLTACEFYSAYADFAELCLFKSGKNEYRSDGTYNIYHEMIPIINVLALVAAGKTKGGIDLSMLENEGGLGVKLQTIINHDNIEDKPISREFFQNSQVEQTEMMLAWLGESKPFPYREMERREWERRNALLVARNVGVVTRKTIVLNESGEPVILEGGKLKRHSEFKNFVSYFRNIIYGPNANITSVMTKYGDAAQNTSSMTGSEKHDTAKKLAWCNTMENMLGRRQGQDKAVLTRWPEHAPEINYWDATLGSLLYFQFSRLEYVEHAYQGQENKYQKGDPLEEIYPSGLDSYLDRALSIPVPRFARMFHTALDRERKLAETDPQVKAWLERSIYPALENHKEHFPEIFAAQPTPQPKELVTAGGGSMSVRGRETRSPSFL